MPRGEGQRSPTSHIMNIVFNKKANVHYKREVTPFEELVESFKFDTSVVHVALRKFHALGDDRDDTYLVIIEGEGNGKKLKTHLFEFQPSERWHCS
jgi:hypothetical protein